MVSDDWRAALRLRTQEARHNRAAKRRQANQQARANRHKLARLGADPTRNYARPWLASGAREAPGPRSRSELYERMFLAMRAEFRRERWQERRLPRARPGAESAYIAEINRLGLYARDGRRGRLLARAAASAGPARTSPPAYGRVSETPERTRPVDDMALRYYDPDDLIDFTDRQLDGMETRLLMQLRRRQHPVQSYRWQPAAGLTRRGPLSFKHGPDSCRRRPLKLNPLEKRFEGTTAELRATLGHLALQQACRYADSQDTADAATGWNRVPAQRALSNALKHYLGYRAWEREQAAQARLQALELSEDTPEPPASEAASSSPEGCFRYRLLPPLRDPGRARRNSVPVHTRVFEPRRREPYSGSDAASSEEEDTGASLAPTPPVEIQVWSETSSDHSCDDNDGSESANHDESSDGVSSTNATEVGINATEVGINATEIGTNDDEKAWTSLQVSWGLAQTFYYLGHRSRAVSLFEEILDMDPSLLPVASMMAKACYDLGDDDKAAWVCGRALDSNSSVSVDSTQDDRQALLQIQAQCQAARASQAALQSLERIGKGNWREKERKWLRPISTMRLEARDNKEVLTPEHVAALAVAAIDDKHGEDLRQEIEGSTHFVRGPMSGPPAG